MLIRRGVAGGKWLWVMSSLPVGKVTDREERNLESQKSQADLIPAAPKSLLGQLLAISETRKVVAGKILPKGRNSLHANFVLDSKGKRRI